ncbi:uncharacterized protein LOC120891383 [Ictidomys tridecemlineatus]
MQPRTCHSGLIHARIGHNSLSLKKKAYWAHSRGGWAPSKALFNQEHFLTTVQSCVQPARRGRASSVSWGPFLLSSPFLLLSCGIVCHVWSSPLECCAGAEDPCVVGLASEHEEMVKWSQGIQPRSSSMLSKAMNGETLLSPLVEMFQCCEDRKIIKDVDASDSGNICVVDLRKQCMPNWF